MTRVRQLLYAVGRMAFPSNVQPDETQNTLKLVNAWLTTSATLIRARRPIEVRDGFAHFVSEHLGAKLVKYIPAELAHEGLGIAVLRLPSIGEAMTLELERPWTPGEAQLAQQAAATVDATLDSLTKLRDAQRDSITDSLTGLLNRRTLDRLLEREVLMAKRHNTPLCAAVVDVDEFKQVNDRFGHEVGDQVLREVAMTIRNVLRRSDLAFRTGGDEFTVILPHTALSQGVTAMEKVRRAVAAAGRVTLSVGVSEWKPNTDGRMTIKAADEAAYLAKRERRDCTRVAA